MNISVYIEPILNGEELVKKLLQDEFGINEINAGILFKKLVKPHFEKFKDNTYILAETNYVDKAFRDSYYHYYSSKLPKYKRDCIRLSFFEDEIIDTSFFDHTQHKSLQEKYRGFIVLRPTDPFIIGRSIISPLLLKTNNFVSCASKFHTTVYGVKFTVNGFPHSSQDTETISCAETSLWAIMEYFSNKYSDYQPILPSKIIKTLNKVSSERQVPSKGLNIAQMSFALKEFGFGTRIYSKEEYSSEFESLFSCYVESGIPIIVAIDNRQNGGNIGHALLAIGHDNINVHQITALPQFTTTDSTLTQTLKTNNITLYDYDNIIKDFVFIDDNHPSYQKAPLATPAGHYGSEWQNCDVTFFIVPLYPKIYLEAYEAKNYVRNFILNGPRPLNNDSEILLRFYLASSRSFKDSLAKNVSFQADLKSILIETSMPKFIWVTEVSSKDLMKEKKANGIIIVDATEANIYFNKPLILAAYQDKMILLNEISGTLESNTLDLHEYRIFEQNLNYFES
ncbi:MAG: hypothetical protein JKY48_01150 [Flavobacteriales bacterium]|nr:hypothetical protein [Flavobacteriales bacterium]